MTSVALFTYSTRPRGSVVHACSLAEALTERGHDVTLYALSKAGDRLFRELSCRVRYLPAAEAPRDPDALIQQRIREVSEGFARFGERHDVYHAEDCLVASGLLAHSPRPAPLVRTLHHFERFESSYLRACQRRSILEADAVTCVSRVSQSDVKRELSRDCPIIGNGVDSARFAPDEELRRFGRARFRAPEGALLVASVGGVEPRKNTLRSLQAMVPVLRRYPTAKWLIAGGSSIWEHEAYRTEFRAQLSALEAPLRERVVELGPVSEQELTALYQVSQILLCPSLQEGFGLCVLEALAAGAAVVVSEREPFTDYLGPDCACFVDPERVGSISAAVTALWEDASRRTALRERGTARALEFSWNNVAQEHERLYRRVIERRVPSSTNAYEDSAHA